VNKVVLLFKRFSLFFLIPYAELVFLRFVISKQEIYQYLILFFSPGKIFYSLIPLVIAFVVFMLFLDKKKDVLPLVFQKKTAAANFLFLIVFLTVSHHLQPLASMLGRQGLSILWYDLGLVTFTTSFLIFFNVSDFFKRIGRYPYEALFSVFSGSLFYLFHLSIHYLWRYLSRSVTLIVYGLLKLFGFDMTYASDGYTLAHPLFSASVGPACSGLEGIFLFLFLFTLILFVDWERYSKKKALAIYLVGMLYMFMLNILRVTVFFIAAIWATQKWGSSQASHLFVWFFHANVGWIFYLIGIIIFFAVLFRLQKVRSLSPGVV
jgi:exosortase/archaeosortase family protein